MAFDEVATALRGALRFRREDDGVEGRAICATFARGHEALYVGGRNAEFTWTSGDPPLKRANDGAGICYLTRIAGDVKGSGETIEIAFRPGYGWYLQGSNSGRWVSGSARCISYVQ